MTKSDIVCWCGCLIVYLIMGLLILACILSINGCRLLYPVQPPVINPGGTTSLPPVNESTMTFWFYIGLILSIIAAINGIKMGYGGAIACFSAIFLQKAMETTMVTWMAGLVISGAVLLLLASFFNKKKGFLCMEFKKPNIKLPFKVVRNK